MSIAQQIQDDQYNAQVAQAWTSAALSRTKKLPPLRNLLRRKHEQTAEQQRDVLHMLAAQYGGRVRTRR